MLHYSTLERLVRDKHSSLLGPFVSYKENGGVVNVALAIYLFDVYDFNISFNFDLLKLVFTFVCQQGPFLSKILGHYLRIGC